MDTVLRARYNKKSTNGKHKVVKSACRRCTTGCSFAKHDMLCKSRHRAFLKPTQPALISKVCQAEVTFMASIAPCGPQNMKYTARTPFSKIYRIQSFSLQFAT